MIKRQVARFSCRQPVTSIRCIVTHFEDLFEMAGALKVAGVVPSEKFFAFDQYGHSLDPLRVTQGFQSSG